MASHDATKGLEQGLETERAVQNREHAFSEGIAEASLALTTTRLRRPEKHDRRRWFDPPQEGQDPVAGWPAIAVQFHRHLQIDHRDVDLLLLDQYRRVTTTPSLKAPDPERVQQPRKLRRRNVLPPSAGEQKVQSGGCRRIGLAS